MPSTVIYDADCGLCQRTRAAVEALDWFRTLRWVPQQDPAALRFGITRQKLEKSVYLVTPGGGRFHGFAAVKQILLRLPAAYVLAAAAVRRQPAAALAGIGLFFAPAFHPVGQIAYEWVARNRYRVPGSTCEAETPASMG